MVPQDFRALSARRAARARLLAARSEATREALEFYAGLAELQGRLDDRDPLRGLDVLRRWVAAAGPAVLRDAAGDLSAGRAQDAIAAYLCDATAPEPFSFFARVLLAPVAAATGAAGLGRFGEREPRAGAAAACPHCGRPPQLGVLRPEGHGTALSLGCSLCLGEWPFARGRCPSCALEEERRIAWYRSEAMPHVQARACEQCRAYLHVVSLAREPAAVPDVDEIAALPLDVWARDRGYRKLHPNLIGA